jgi:hypothetical protein
VSIIINGNLPPYQLFSAISLSSQPHISFVTTSIGKKEVAIAMVSPTLPLAFIETAFKVIPPNAFKDSIDKVSLINISVGKDEDTLSI